MKSINQKSAEIFNKLVGLLDEEGHVKIDNTDGVFMYVSFEKLTDTTFVGRPASIYAMAHYFEMNGDLVPDPDMTFIALKEQPEKIYPATFQNAIKYTDAIYTDDKRGVWRINEMLQHDLAHFANIWLKNIKEQQGI